MYAFSGNVHFYADDTILYAIGCTANQAFPGYSPLLYLII